MQCSMNICCKKERREEKRERPEEGGKVLSWKRDGLSPALPFMLRGPKDASDHPHASVSPCERVCVGGTPPTSSVLSGKLRRVW